MGGREESVRAQSARRAARGVRIIIIVERIHYDYPYSSPPRVMGKGRKGRREESTCAQSSAGAYKNYYFLNAVVVLVRSLPRVRKCQGGTILNRPESS